MKPFTLPVGFFLLGVLFLLVGGMGGERIAVIISRPYKAVAWSTSERLINIFTLIPMIIGITFLILFICTFTISFYNSQKKG